jgi:hypothetical protein
MREREMKEIIKRERGTLCSAPRHHVTTTPVPQPTPLDPLIKRRRRHPQQRRSYLLPPPPSPLRNCQNVARTAAETATATASLSLSHFEICERVQIDEALVPQQVWVAPDRVMQDVDVSVNARGVVFTLTDCTLVGAGYICGLCGREESTDSVVVLPIRRRTR